MENLRSRLLQTAKETQQEIFGVEGRLKILMDNHLQVTGDITRELMELRLRMQNIETLLED